MLLKSAARKARPAQAFEQGDLGKVHAGAARRADFRKSQLPLEVFEALSGPDP